MNGKTDPHHKKTQKRFQEDAVAKDKLLNPRVNDPIRILHWTVGKGTGHIKRVNALWRGFALAGCRVDYYLFAPQSMFLEVLNPHVRVWQEGFPDTFDLLIIDQRLDRFPLEFAGLASTLVQLCKLSTRLDGHPDVLATLKRVSFENCAVTRDMDLPYDGCLIDADPEEVLSESEARDALSELTGLPMSGRLALTQANTCEAEAACKFLLRGMGKLLNSYPTVVVNTGHLASLHDRLLDEALKHPGRKVVLLDINPMLPYIRAFDHLHIPIGYNTYCESQLFVRASCSYEAMHPRDQHLRLEELPEVERIGNKEIALRTLGLMAEEAG